jgi:hypothetical protein
MLERYPARGGVITLPVQFISDFTLNEGKINK